MNNNFNKYRNQNHKPRFRGNNSRRGRGENIDISRLIKKAEVQTTAEAYVPNLKFDELDISNELKENIKRKGFTSPTPIQDQSIPHIMARKDVVGIANTGTGKTGAFLIPLIDKVLKNKSEKVLIIAPTRELA